VADGLQLLDADEARARVNVTELTGAMFSPHTAAIHPGKLVRGLARALERRGVTIYEQTAVTRVHPGRYPTLETNKGNVRAKSIVLCGEAYLSQLPGYGRAVMPVYSLITLTEPLTETDWAEIGWSNHECVASCRYTVDYLSRTADGRILFGGRGAPYRFGSRITPAMDKHAGTHQMLQDNLRAWFPRLQDVRFSHTWGGPLGWSRDFMPTVSFDPAQGIGMAHGYTGNGVSTTNLAGRTLADMITGHQSELLRLPHANHKTRLWEPEPFRFLGVRFVQRSFMKIDREAEQSGIAPSGKSLAERLTAH
jgi:glycine/D-amino acid oxidase-like deaminating enzyme